MNAPVGVAHCIASLRAEEASAAYNKPQESARRGCGSSSLILYSIDVLFLVYNHMYCTDERRHHGIHLCNGH